MANLVEDKEWEEEWKEERKEKNKRKNEESSRNARQAPGNRGAQSRWERMKGWKDEKANRQRMPFGGAIAARSLSLAAGASLEFGRRCRCCLFGSVCRSRWENSSTQSNFLTWWKRFLVAFKYTHNSSTHIQVVHTGLIVRTSDV